MFNFQNRKNHTNSIHTYYSSAFQIWRPRQSPIDVIGGECLFSCLYLILENRISSSENPQALQSNCSRDWNQTCDWILLGRCDSAKLRKLRKYGLRSFKGLFPYCGAAGSESHYEGSTFIDQLPASYCPHKVNPPFIWGPKLQCLSLFICY